jgi:hypothetical protein
MSSFFNDYLKIFKLYRYNVHHSEHSIRGDHSVPSLEKPLGEDFIKLFSTEKVARNKIFFLTSLHSKLRPRVKTQGIGIPGFAAFIPVINHRALCGTG